MKKNIVFEIGTEELPAFELHAVTDSLKQTVEKLINKKFEYSEIEIYTTPRRIIVKINEVPEIIEGKTIESRGPATRIAFDENGNATKAAEGFARGNGLTANDLIVKEIDGTEYVFAVKDIPEKDISSILPEVLLNIITSIKWKKSQRWGDLNDLFARPVRWILAMFGDEVIDLEYAGLKSSNITYGHKFLSNGQIEISDSDQLITVLNNNFVITTEAEREEIIKSQIKDIESDLGLVASLPRNIMTEVVNLCEYPTCMVGQFNESFLDVPKEIIVDAMLVHQRYFPLFNQDGSLTNNFIIVSNGDKKYKETIIDGNQRVVAARLYDAQFFFDEDKKQPLEAYVDKLDEVVFQEKLGTMKLKAQRISSLAGKIAELSDLSSDEKNDAERAGKLAKADLITNAVVEFTQVQGIMGYYYALASGENENIAIAIRDHYKPSSSGGELPSTKIAKCVAVADKIDTLCGMFAINQAPNGSSDPFALRRGAIGIISIMLDDFKFTLSDIIKASLDQFESQGIDFDKNECFNEVVKFIITRTKVLLKDQGINHDSIEAVSAINVIEPLDFIDKAKALDYARKENGEVFDDLATAFARANNLRDESLGIDFNKTLMGDFENKLTEAIEIASENIDKLLKNNDYAGALSQLALLRGPIDEFFEGVMVMDKDEELKNNRLKVLNAFAKVFSNIADFSKMAKNKK